MIGTLVLVFERLEKQQMLVVKMLEVLEKLEISVLKVLDFLKGLKFVLALPTRQEDSVMSWLLTGAITLACIS